METPKQAHERELKTRRNAALAVCWMLKNEPIGEIHETLDMLGLLDLTNGFPKTSDLPALDRLKK